MVLRMQMAMGIISLVTFQFPIFNLKSAIYNLILGEVTELVPVPDFKSGGSWLWSGMVSSILMLSRHS